MELVTISQSKGVPFIVGEKCLIRNDGNFVGQETGTVYSQDNYRESMQFKAIIDSVDDDNLTGMYHLYKGWNDEEDNRKSFKEKYLGCFVTLEGAHYADGLKIYRCLELDEYFSENEVEIIE